MQGHGHQQCGQSGAIRDAGPRDVRGLQDSASRIAAGLTLRMNFLSGIKNPLVAIATSGSDAN